ncbi:MAG: acyl-CoA thioesterase [Deltaproteobacteria bacterium]|nr:acyl-CoA thioesterase [Deltaproteobacteria bacterium]
MEGKRVSDTRIVMAAQMNPEDANPAGNVHGGVIMKYVDTAAGAVAIRHARRIAVTASIDRLDFHHPVLVGNILILKASLNFVGRTSMEVGVRVEAENLLTGDVRHTASAYLTFVALDQTGKPAEVPPLILETDEDRRRNCEAIVRRKARLEERERERRERSELERTRPVGGKAVT